MRRIREKKSYNYASKRFSNRLARNCRIIPQQGGISICNKFDIEFQDGAGCPGDYLYRSGSFAWGVESGMWGIFRVMKQIFGHRCKAIYRKIRECF